jgi:hypothetical protein
MTKSRLLLLTCLAVGCAGSRVQQSRTAAVVDGLFQVSARAEVLSEDAFVVGIRVSLADGSDADGTGLAFFSVAAGETSEHYLEYPDMSASLCATVTAPKSSALYSQVGLELHRHDVSGSTQLATFSLPVWRMLPPSNPLMRMRLTPHPLNG